MISDPIGTPLISPLGLGLARDIGTIVAFGAIFWVYDSWIWPNVREYVTKA